MSKKRYIITEELRRQLKNADLSLNKISAKAGFEVKNIVHRNKTIREDHLANLSALFNIKFSLKEAHLNYEKNLGEFARSAKLKKLEQGEHLAEFIGILLGDGYLSNVGIKIAFDNRDVKYMEYVNSLFNKLIGHNFKRRESIKPHYACLYFYSKELVNELIKNGLSTGDKIKNQEGIPEWIFNSERYIVSCLRGLIDTDGCIYVCRRERQKYIKFTNFNKRLLSDFKKLTEMSGYHFAKANDKNFCLYRKDEVNRFLDEIKPLKDKGFVGQSASLLQWEELKSHPQ